MSSESGGNGGTEAMAAAKGALLIGLAVVVGLLLLQQVDKSAPTAATTTSTSKPKATTTTTRPADTSSTASTTTTTVAALPTKTPAQLGVIVLNGGSAPAGSAGKMRSQLITAGYTNQAQAGDWPNHPQKGHTVMCKPGLSRDASSLAVAVGKGTPVPVVAYASNLPSGATSSDCVVVVGST